MDDAERFAVYSPCTHLAPTLHLPPSGEDKVRREAVDTKNQAESMIYQTEKQVKEFEAKVPAEVRVRTGGMTWMGETARIIRDGDK